MIFFFCLVLITRPFSVLFHELGHAIPAILLTKQKVAIYIGLNGNPANSLKLTIGLLEIWFCYNPFSWIAGHCVPTAKSVSINRQMIYILTGPLASFAIGGIACYLTFYCDFHGFIKVLLVIFFGSSIFDFFLNLIPIERPIKLNDGTIGYNDGYWLKRLFYFKQFHKKYARATDLYNQQKYFKAASIFKAMLRNDLHDPAIYDLRFHPFCK